MMNYETTAQALEGLRRLQETLGAYHHVMGVTDFDAATAAPKGSHEGRGKVITATPPASLARRSCNFSLS